MCSVLPSSPMKEGGIKPVPFSDSIMLAVSAVDKRGQDDFVS